MGKLYVCPDSYQVCLQLEEKLGLKKFHWKKELDRIVMEVLTEQMEEEACRRKRWGLCPSVVRAKRPRVKEVTVVELSDTMDEDSEAANATSTRRPPWKGNHIYKKSTLEAQGPIDRLTGVKRKLPAGLGDAGVGSDRKQADTRHQQWGRMNVFTCSGCTRGPKTRPLTPFPAASPPSPVRMPWGSPGKARGDGEGPGTEKKI